MKRRKPAAPSFLEFCERLPDAPLSPAQRALAAVAFDGAPVPAEFSEMFGGHVGPVPAQARRTVALLCGRASGKTRLLALYVLWRLLFARVKLARGEVGFGVIFSPTLELSEQTLRFARGALEGTKYERAITAETKSSFTLKRPDGALVRFAVLAAKAKGTSGRGRTLIAAALDEACFFAPETAGQVNDATVYRALPPRLVEGGAIVLASTPWTQAGLLWELHSKQFGTPETALVAVAKTEIMRGDDETVLADCARERARDPDNAARELDCEWLPTGGGNAFDLASLQGALAEVAPPSPGESVFVGADLAQVKDRSAFVAVRANGSLIEVVDAVELKPQRGAPLSLALIAREAKAFVERNHAIASIRIDHHLLEPVRETCASSGIGVAWEACSEASADRELRFGRAIDAFKSGRVRIPERFAWLTDQLSEIVATPRDGGGVRYTVQRRGGSHADGASAFLLACEQVLARTLVDWSDPQVQGAMMSASLGFGGVRPLSAVDRAGTDPRLLDRLDFADRFGGGAFHVGSGR